jgi:hypothetical protein
MDAGLVTNERRPRASYLPILERMALRVERQVEHTLRWSDPYAGAQESVVAATALYVFGSFARGASLCGDLDVILEVELVTGLYAPPTSSVRAAVLGRLVDVDVRLQVRGQVLGAPLAEHPEARLIWSREQPDWRANIAAIPLDEAAGHFERKTDRLPVHLKQLAIRDREEAERFVDRIDSGELVSEWVPLDTITPQPETWDTEHQHVLKAYQRDLGADTAKLLPFVLQYLYERRNTTHSGLCLRWGRPRACLHLGGFYVHMGRPALSWYLLDRADVSTLILAPHLKKGFAAGLWTLRRGPNHEASRAAASLRTWTLASSSDAPIIFNWSNEAHREKQAMDLYPTQEAAQYVAAQLDTGVVELSGTAVLELVSHVEAVLIGEEEVVVHGDITSGTHYEPKSLLERLAHALAEEIA